jgi:hypothetical protein
MAICGKEPLIAAVLLVGAGAVPLARAATAPADACSLLTAAQVSSTLRGMYGVTEKTVAPRPYANTVQGTDCHYKVANGTGALLFRIYFDPSAAEATSLFAKLKMFYSPPTPVPGLGDEAYFDPRHGLHVRKGNVRFFLDLGKEDDFTPANQEQVTALAGQVAGQL